MIVVADTTPINYLILIDAIGVLEPLYNSVVIPETVLSELSQPGTPTEVRVWIGNRPTWLDVAADPAPLPELEALDPGERAAIALALVLPAGRLLIDDAGRIEAERRRLNVTGTLGVLAAAHRNRLLDFD